MPFMSFINLWSQLDWYLFNFSFVLFVTKSYRKENWDFDIIINWINKTNFVTKMQYNIYGQFKGLAI